MKKKTSTAEETRKKLINSFWKLYKKKDLSKITIGEICTNANYERTTFYRYFTDINDILNQLEDEIINGIIKRIEKKTNLTTGITYNRFKRFVSTYGEYIIILNEKGERRFCNKFKNLIKNNVYDYFGFNIQDENKKDFLFEFMFSSLINSFVYWYNHQDIMSLEAFVKLVNGMILNSAKILEKYNT